MWKGHLKSLCHYGLAMVAEIHRRGIESKHADRGPFVQILEENADSTSARPAWTKDKKFHAAHRSNLLAKDPVHYSQFNWKEEAGLPYLWPVPG